MAKCTLSKLGFISATLQSWIVCKVLKKEKQQKHTFLLFVSPTSIKNKLISFRFLIALEFLSSLNHILEVPEYQQLRHMPVSPRRFTRLIYSSTIVTVDICIKNLKDRYSGNWLYKAMSLPELHDSSSKHILLHKIL